MDYYAYFNGIPTYYSPYQPMPMQSCQPMPMQVAPQTMAVLTSEDASKVQTELLCQQVEHMIQQEQIQGTIIREEVKLQASLEKENAKLGLHEKVRDERDLKVPIVHHGAGGRVYLAIKRSEDKQSISRILIEEEMIAVTRYITKFPEEKEIFALVFRKGKKHITVIYIPVPNENNARKLVNKLENAGVHLNVSRRLKGDVSDAFYAFVCKKAETKEIASRYGFNLMEDKTWYFCEPDEITMEVLENERK